MNKLDRMELRRTEWIILATAVPLLGLFMLSGCTLFRSTDYKMPDLPPIPEPSPALQEAERQALDFGAKVLAKVADEGVPPAQPLVQQAAEATQAGRARMGNPANPIVLPSFGQRSGEMDRQVGEIRAELALLRIRVAQWREKYGQALGAPIRRRPSSGRCQSGPCSCLPAGRWWRLCCWASSRWCCCG